LSSLSLLSLHQAIIAAEVPPYPSTSAGKTTPASESYSNTIPAFA
jgi:hypothetical protein